MKSKAMLYGLLALLLASTAWAEEGKTSVQDSGTTNVRTEKYTRTSDGLIVHMQSMRPGWLELNFGSTNNCTDTAGVCNAPLSTTIGGQIFDQIALANGSASTSQLISVSGASLSGYLAVTCECDANDSDVDIEIEPVYVHFNLSANKDSHGARINMRNTIGVTGNTFETGFRQMDLKIIETLGAKEMKIRLYQNAGASPQISCWFSRL